MIAGTFVPPMVQTSCYRALFLVGAIGCGGAVMDLCVLLRDRLAEYELVRTIRLFAMGQCGWVVVTTETPYRWIQCVLLGAGIYTTGAFFFLSRMEFHLVIWHLFVVAATACIFVANWSYIDD